MVDCLAGAITTVIALASITELGGDPSEAEMRTTCEGLLALSLGARQLSKLLDCWMRVAALVRVAVLCTPLKAASWFC